MRTRATIILLAAAVGLAACAAQPRWSDRLDITVTGRGLMICIVDAKGAAQCYHRDGVLTSTVGAQGVATCPGIDQRLESACDGSDTCIVRNVGVPTDAFGMLFVELKPPIFGVPRHVVTEAAIVARRADALDATLRSSLENAARAHARCLAPKDSALLRRDAVPVVTRAECEAQACALRRVSLRLAWPRAARAEGR
jgi:hypothetical protein